MYYHVGGAREDLEPIINLIFHFWHWKICKRSQVTSLFRGRTNHRRKLRKTKWLKFRSQIGWFSVERSRNSLWHTVCCIQYVEYYMASTKVNFQGPLDLIIDLRCVWYNILWVLQCVCYGIQFVLQFVEVGIRYRELRTV